MPDAVRSPHFRQTSRKIRTSCTHNRSMPRGTPRALLAASLALGAVAFVGTWIPTPHAASAATPMPRLATASQVAPVDTRVRLAPTIRGVPLTSKVVALTFDDGPSPVFTPKVLDLLRQSGAHATFFVLGQEALRYPDLLKQEVRDGNEIGLHGMRHLVLYGRQTDEVEAEVREAEDTVTGILGKKPVLYRLPQGKGDTVAREVLGRRGYLIIQWSVDPRDYLRPSPEAMVASVMRQVKPGTIIIFHDGGGPRSRTVEAVAQILPRLKADGYTVTTVGDLLARAHFPMPAQHQGAQSTPPLRDQNV